MHTGPHSLLFLAKKFNTSAGSITRVMPTEDYYHPFLSKLDRPLPLEFTGLVSEPCILALGILWIFPSIMDIFSTFTIKFHKIAND
jgi:hypothetical protein